MSCILFCKFCTLVFFSVLLVVPGQQDLGIYAPDYVVMNISNKSVKLYCNSSQHDDATFTWYHNGTLLNYTTDSSDKSAKYYYSKEKEFIIKQLNINDAGTYKCVLVEDSRSFEVYSVPHIPSKTLAHSYNKVEGDTISLNCTVEAYPEAVVFWNKSNGILIETDRIKLTNGTHFASLTIENLESDDRDVYHCIAINKYGSASHDVLIRVKDKLAALWPFLGICAEVAILCTIIFIYEKRRSKEEMEEEEPTQEEKSVSNSNQKDKDIRQRK